MGSFPDTKISDKGISLLKIAEKGVAKLPP